jgi:hypothetical protein
MLVALQPLQIKRVVIANVNMQLLKNMQRLICILEPLDIEQTC